MTRPIGEPSISKEQGSQDFGIRQLFRRPAPISAEPPKVFRAMQWDIETTTGTGVDMERVAFDLWSNPDPAVFGTQNDVNDDLVIVGPTVPGYFVVSMYINCGQSYDASVAGLIEDGENVWPGQGAEHTRKMRAGTNAGFVYLVTMGRYYPTIDWEEGTHGAQTDLPLFSFYVGQASGVSRTFQTRVDITYWSAIAGEISS